MFINALCRLKACLTAILFVFIVTLSSTATAEDKVFTSAEFLTWKESSQDFYIEASVGMAGFIAVKTDENKIKAPCIDNWYYTDESKQNEFIRGIMRKNSEFHPRAIILGVLEKQCGKF